MGRTLALFLRFSVIASAVAMLFFCVRAAQAQGFSPAPGSTAPPASTALGAQGEVYGYNPGQGVTRVPTAPSAIMPMQAPMPAAPQGPYGYRDFAGQNFVPAPTTPYQAAPYPSGPMMAQAQPAYGYGPQPAPYNAPLQVQPQIQQPSAQGQMAYGYKAGYGPVGGGATYGTQMPADPQAYYQQPDAAMNGAQRSNPDYQLGPGDKVRVTVFGEADLSGDYQVDGSGMVRLPLIGTLRAAGYTAPGLENWIGSTLARGYMKSPRVNVEIITYRPFYIIGAVNKPGEYPYVDHMGALNAVAMAGGFTDTAKQSTVYVRHENSPTEYEVPTDQLSSLRPGDTIRVKTTLFWDAMGIFTPLAPAAFAAAAIR